MMAIFFNKYFMALERKGPDGGGDDYLDVESPGIPQPRLPGRLDFPTRPQAAMNVVGQLEFGDPKTALRAFEVLRRDFS